MGETAVGDVVPRVEGYDADALAALGHFGVPYNDHLGIVWELLSPDRVVAHLDIAPEHLQPYGIVHGGVYCSLVEAVGSLAGAARVAGQGMQAVGVHNATSFVRPMREGRLVTTATPIHVGRTQHLWRVDVTRAGDDALVAHGELRMQVVQVTAP